MILKTHPVVDCGAPFVVLTVGESEARLTTRQAEDISESLSRAATAARYEASIIEMLGLMGHSVKESQGGVDRVRRLMEARRLKEN